MKHFLWQFQNLNIPMMEDEGGTLYTTGSVLAGALGVTPQNLRSIYANHRDEFDGVSVNAIDANEFLQQHKEAFGVQRVRQDMHLWTEDDMILFAALSNSDQGKEFRKGMKQVIKTQARKGLITKEYFDSVVSQLVAQNVELLERVTAVEAAQPAFDRAASAAGTMLQAQKHTKGFRS
jgi:hypothetical protein